MSRGGVNLVDPGTRLLDEMGDLWEVVLDLLTFFHECCVACQPWDEGPVWLSERHDISEALQEIVIEVSEVNGLALKTEVDSDSVSQAFDQKPTSCPNCGCEWDSSMEIGGSWLVLDGEDTSKATYILTRKFWPYLTHFTKKTEKETAIELLQKIVKEGLIRGSNKLITGSYFVVAFTECSPLEILELIKASNRRNYSGIAQPHVPVQWNRSGYGVAIKRQTVTQGLALPVIHGDVSIYNSLPVDQKFRYVRWTPSGAWSDWTFEREYRVNGDVNLNKFSPYDVAIVVPDRSNRFSLLARKEVFPFPVIALDYVYSSDAPSPKITRRQRALFDKILANR